MSYIPSKTGEYFVHILCDEEDIEGSPYVATILSQSELRPHLVECTGPGLDPNKVLLVNQPADFSVDPRQAGGSAPLLVQVMDSIGTPVPVKVTQEPNGVAKCSYVPKKPGKHTVLVSFRF